MRWGRAEASLSLQAGGTGSTGNPRSASVAAAPQTDEEQGKGAGQRFWQPGSVDFRSEGNPTGIFALKEVPQGTTQSQKGILASGAREGRASTAGRDTGDTRGKGCSGFEF